MNVVPQYLDLRRRLMQAAVELSDERVQQRLWARGERLTGDELGFDDSILVVVDEFDLFRDQPSELVGHVLVNQDELDGFIRLRHSLDELVRAIGPSGRYEDALRSGSPWQEVVTSAESLRRAMQRGDLATRPS